MTTIELLTKIEAPIESIFNLSRDIDFHMESASQTKEVAIAGKTKGLISLGETVTWRGKHFGFYLKHTSKIIKMATPQTFTDIMIEGHFIYFCHDHFFEENDGVTLMKDMLRYKTPYGIFGRIFNVLFLKSHLREFLIKRNEAIKRKAQKNAS
ncbi:SRPBCC family protein [Patiriisocius sp. Uisw_017]|uniref:SRPBCC family protein n=1 Tax=Patiriisocius sp. Uisw_017 TaxID=3230968 RepID=UPI0039E9A991